MYKVEYHAFVTFEPPKSLSFSLFDFRCLLKDKKYFVQVVTAEKVSSEGLLEKLTMTVVVPLLWGVPPASDTLCFAVRSGGGIVEKVYWQWNFL